MIGTGHSFVEQHYSYIANNNVMYYVINQLPLTITTLSSLIVLVKERKIYYYC